MRRPLTTIVVAAAAALLGSDVRGGADTTMSKYQSLLQEKRTLLRENAFLQVEADMAATKSAYVLFYLDLGKLEFRVRGKAFKSYAFSPITLDDGGRRVADAETMWRALDKPLTVLEVQGAHPELVPPDPNSAKQDGQLYSDPNQLAAQTGTGPVHSDAGVLGVDVPTDYYIKFDEDVVFHIRTPKTRTFREKAADRLTEIARAMRATISGIWGSKEIESGQKPRFELYLTTDTDTAKFLHYSLLPGERFIAVPPPPPPIALVAAASEGRSGGGTVPVAR